MYHRVQMGMGMRIWMPRMIREFSKDEDLESPRARGSFEDGHPFPMGSREV